MWGGHYPWMNEDGRYLACCADGLRPVVSRPERLGKEEEGSDVHRPGIAFAGPFTGSPKLPIGLQLLGKPFGEETVLRIAHAYEQATDWHLARPGL